MTSNSSKNSQQKLVNSNNHYKPEARIFVEGDNAYYQELEGILDSRKEDPYEIIEDYIEKYIADTKEHADLSEKQLNIFWGFMDDILNGLLAKDDSDKMHEYFVLFASEPKLADKLLKFIEDNGIEIIDNSSISDTEADSGSNNSDYDSSSIPPLVAKILATQVALMAPMHKF